MHLADVCYSHSRLRKWKCHHDLIGALLCVQACVWAHICCRYYVFTGSKVRGGGCGDVGNERKLTDEETDILELCLCTATGSSTANHPSHTQFLIDSGLTIYYNQDADSRLCVDSTGGNGTLSRAFRMDEQAISLAVATVCSAADGSFQPCVCVLKKDGRSIKVHPSV